MGNFTRETMAGPELGARILCVAAHIPLTSHRFRGDRGSKTRRLMARPCHSPQRERPDADMLPPFRARAPPTDVSEPAANRIANLLRGVQSGRGPAASRERKWRGGGRVVSPPRVPMLCVGVSLWGSCGILGALFNHQPGRREPCCALAVALPPRCRTLATFFPALASDSSAKFSIGPRVGAWSRGGACGRPGAGA